MLTIKKNKKKQTKKPLISRYLEVFYSICWCTGSTAKSLFLRHHLFFCSSEEGTCTGVHRVSGLYDCCVGVCMGVPVSNRYPCAPRIYDAASKTVEFLTGRVSVSFWPWQWSPGKVTWWAAGRVVLSQGAPHMSLDEDVNAAWTILPDSSRDQVSHLKMMYWKRKESSGQLVAKRAQTWDFRWLFWHKWF